MGVRCFHRVGLSIGSSLFMQWTVLVLLLSFFFNLVIVFTNSWKWVIFNGDFVAIAINCGVYSSWSCTSVLFLEWFCVS